MNIKDLPQGSYKVVQPGKMNIKDLPAGSYKNVTKEDSFPKEEPETVKRNFLQKTAGFLGIEKFGQGLSVLGSNTPERAGDEVGMAVRDTNTFMQKIRSEVDPAKKQYLIEQMKKIYGVDFKPTSAEEVNPGLGLSNKEVLGSAANVGLNVLAAGGLSNTGKLASTATKINRVANPFNTAKATGRVLNTGVKFGALGASFGVAEGMNQNESVGEIAKRATTSAAISGGLGIGVQGLAEFGKVLTSSKLGESMINRELGVPKNVIKAGKSPAKDILASGTVNSKRGYLNKAEKTIKISGDAIKSELKQNNILHKTPELVDGIRAQLSQVYKDALSADDIEKIIDNLPISSLRNNSAMTIDRINNLRSILDNKYLGNKKWLAAAEAVQPERITGLKVAANVLRSKVQGTVPTTIPHFQEMAKALTTKHILDDELAKPHLLSNILEGMSSIIAGFGTGGMSVEGAATAASVFAGIKMLTSTPAVTGTAIGLKKAGQAAVGPAGNAIRGAVRTGTQRIIQKTQKKKK